MKTLAIATAALLAAVAGLPAHAQHDHAAHAHVAQPIPVPATKWHADADLNDGVSRIHAALLALGAFEVGQMDRAGALEQAARIEAATTDIFAKCKLGPEQDAALHAMLVPLLRALHAFREPTGGAAEVEAMRHAMAAYPRYFDRPQWRAAPH